MAQPTPTKTRTPSMRWIELGKGKDPEFNQLYFLCQQGIYFTSGYLKSKEETDKGKVYKFEAGLTIVQNNEGKPDSIEPLIITDVSHYCLPVTPNN
jgi:hypothetical protein